MSTKTNEVMNQVAEVLDGIGLPYNLDGEGGFLLEFAGESEDERILVSLRCGETDITIADETYALPVLFIQAPLVIDFELTPGNLARALLASNQFNESALMKMRVQLPKPAMTIEEAATGEAKGWIYMEAGIAATDLQPQEIIFLLLMLKDTADEVDDILVGGLGGRTFFQLYRDGSTTGGLTLDI